MHWVWIIWTLALLAMMKPQCDTVLSRVWAVRMVVPYGAGMCRCPLAPCGMCHARKTIYSRISMIQISSSREKICIIRKEQIPYVKAWEVHLHKLAYDSRHLFVVAWPSRSVQHNWRLLHRRLAAHIHAHSWRQRHAGHATSLTASCVYSMTSDRRVGNVGAMH